MHQNYIALPNDLFTGFDFANGVTVMLDVKPNAACSAGNGDWVRLMQFFKHANAPSGSEGEGDFYLSQGLIATAAYNGMTSQYLDASKAALVTSDRWHTVVMTLGGGFLSVYLDGSLVGQQLDTSNLLSQLNNFSQNYIGNSIRQDNDFAGLVKNFRVYNRALQQSELSKIGIGGKVRLYSGRHPFGTIYHYRSIRSAKQPGNRIIPGCALPENRRKASPEKSEICIDILPVCSYHTPCNHILHRD